MNKETKKRVKSLVEDSGFKFKYHPRIKLYIVQGKNGGAAICETPFLEKDLPMEIMLNRAKVAIETVRAND